MRKSILAVYREPFALGPVRVARLPAGITIAEMLRLMPGLPEDFVRRGTICINGIEAPRGFWTSIKPKPDAVTEVTFHAAPLGGGSDGKNPLALIASIALLAATGWVAGGGLAGRFGLGAAFEAGGIGAKLAAAGVALAGQALIGSMAPAPGLPAPAQADARRSGEASADGNVLTPNGPVPRVIGTRKVFPSFACEPLVWFDGEDEVVEAVYALAGPHDLSDIRLGSARIEEMPGLDYETREGWPGDAALTVVTRQARTDDLSTELRGHVLEDDGVTVDQGADGGYLPQPYVIATRDDPDEYRLGLTFPRGLSQNASETVRLRVPVRIRIRESGSSTWIALPELHFVGVALAPMRATIRLVWTDTPTTQPAAAQNRGWVEARIATPDQTAAPAGGAWAAHGSFDDGSGGDDWIVANNLNSSAVQNVILGRHEAQIQLDTASIPKGRYEIEVTRGAAILDSTYAPATYEVSGTVWDLFGVQGEAIKQIVRDQSDLVTTLGLVRGSSIWNAPPVATDEFALIAIRARNRQLQPLSVVASGYVQDHDGSDWTTWTTTSNPAPHFRDIMVGRGNADPVPVALLDDDDLVEWRTRCASLAFEANMIIEGGTVGQAMERVAAAGFALPRMSNTWGIVQWKDTSADDPVFRFTTRNMRGFGFEKAFPKLPDGIRATFRDSTRDYQERQIVHPDTAVGGLLEQVDYDEVTEAEVRRKAAFDLAARRYQATKYAGTVPPESLAVRRGDLVGIEYDMLSARRGSARVIDFSLDGSGYLTGVTLDGTVPITNEPSLFSVTDLFAVDDLFAVGLTPALVIDTGDGGQETHLLSDATGETDTLTIATPAATSIALDDFAVVGPSERVLERMIVSDIQRGQGMTADLTFVDELTFDATL